MTDTDRTHIALDQPHEVHYWTRKLDIPRSRLAEAVETVGNKAVDVRAWLDSQEADSAPDKDGGVAAAVTELVKRPATTTAENPQPEDLTKSTD